MAQGALQTRFGANLLAGPFGIAKTTVEDWLWHERESLILWVPVLFGGGIAAWFLLPGRTAWLGFMMCMAALSVIGLLLGGARSRFSAVVAGSGLAALLGCATIWVRSEWVAAPVLERPAIVTFGAHVRSVEALPARNQVRLILQPETGAGLPGRVRVTADSTAIGIDRVGAGDAVRLRARLAPPPRAALPGGYDFAQRAWFDRIGAVGSLIGPIARDERFGPPTPGLRTRLSNHVRERIDGGAGAIAAALATGDRGGISQADDEAMRRSGLAHLLSISGLHVSAMIAGTMFLLLRVLALSTRLALRSPLMLIAAGGGAVAGFGYTILTGGEVPTVRSLLAALLVLAAIAMGREAISMRLLAAGAMVVMLLWPEAIAGPSFQLSFAAVASIIALHSHRRVRAWLARRDEPLLSRLLRSMAGLLATGLVVELALMPIALFHFHKAGLYGALANMVAIPLTTFVVMPFEAAALALDMVGLGAPAWWVVEQALGAMLRLAHGVSAAPGAVAFVPTMPTSAFAAMIIGGLWVLLWRGRHRSLGLISVAGAMIWTLSLPSPDLLVTADGRHVSVSQPQGGYAMLRERSGDFVRQQLAEAAGIDAIVGTLDDMPGARCSPDFCIWTMQRGGRNWTILAARSNLRTPWESLIAACGRADIVIADRRLPPACAPRWLKVDREILSRTGGLSINLARPGHTASRSASRGKPWDSPPTVMPLPQRPLTKQAVAGASSPFSDNAAITRRDALEP